MYITWAVGVGDMERRERKRVYAAVGSRRQEWRCAQAMVLMW
jgi:hypothetical protein